LRHCATDLLAPLETVHMSAFDLAPSPRFPSTLPKLDQRTEGGFYGLTAIGGNAGVGKSTLATSCACDFALAGGKVVCLNAEMTKKQVLSRVWYASNGRSRQIVDQALRLVQVNHTIGFKDIVEHCFSALDFEDDRMLIVIDSINTIADMASAQSGVPYFTILSDLVGWCATVRRRSEGKVAFVLVSELNARGEVKGLKLEYVADLVVRLTKAETPEFVEVEVSKGREGGRGALGTYFVDWRAGRLRGAE